MAVEVTILQPVNQSLKRAAVIAPQVGHRSPLLPHNHGTAARNHHSLNGHPAAIHVHRMSLHVAVTGLLSGHQNLRPRQQESVDRTRLALRVHLAVIAARLGILDAMVLQLRLSVATVRLTGHLDQLLHLNATMDLIVVELIELIELIELNAQSQMNSGIVARHGLDNHPQDHGILAASRDQTATCHHSPSVHKPAAISTGEGLRFQPAGLTGMNVRGRHALPSLTAQEHHAPPIAGLIRNSVSAAGRNHRMHAALPGAGMVNVVEMVLFCGQR